MTAITLTLRYGKGYAGRLGTRCWVAQIMGSSREYGLDRLFLEPVSVERAHFNRARTMVYFTYALEADGLYEASEGGERWFVGALPQKSGAVKLARIGDEEVRRWVDAMDRGLSARKARIARKEVVAPSSPAACGELKN